MSEVVRPLLQSAAAIAQERHLTLIPCWQDGLDPVWLDPAALSEVVSNLLDNALKYAPSGAWIWVLDGLEKTVAGQPFQGLAVGDTGAGFPWRISPTFLNAIFGGAGRRDPAGHRAGLGHCQRTDDGYGRTFRSY